MAAEEHPELTAIEVAETHGMRLEPAAANRAWMSATPQGFARHCLPMLLANQHGWVLTCPAAVRLVWDGTAGLEAVTVEPLADDTHPDALPTSHFGDGIVTWRLPFLFRTPRDVDVLLRGPANLPKDGASALEGLIESDWSPATGTMNWMLTRPHHPIVFEQGEPIAMVVPVPRGYVEDFEPRRVALHGSDVADDYRAWRENRTDFMDNLAPRSRSREEWQGDYFRGEVNAVRPTGSRPHQTRLRVREFAAPDEAPTDAG